MRKIFSNIAEAEVLPDIIHMRDNLFCAKFFLMKLLPAKFILEDALAKGLITRSTVVLESTSGTFGLALAILCNHYKLKLILVSDPAIDSVLKARLEELGATIDICDKPAENGGYQQARLDKLAVYRRMHTDHFFPAQYENKMNPGAYALFAEQLISAFGKVDILVGSVGSGGSMCGTLKYLRKIHPGTKGVGVDSDVSMLFGRPDAGAKRIIRGLGNSLMPQNLDHSQFDEVHWLTAGEIAQSTRNLHSRHGIYSGPTSGATYKVADYLASKYPTKNVVFISADEGYRYGTTIYNDEWMSENGFIVSSSGQLSKPVQIEHPEEAINRWSFMDWGRRNLQSITARINEAEAECL